MSCQKNVVEPQFVMTKEMFWNSQNAKVFRDQRMPPAAVARNIAVDVKLWRWDARVPSANRSLNPGFKTSLLFCSFSACTVNPPAFLWDGLANPCIADVSPHDRLMKMTKCSGGLVVTLKKGRRCFGG